VQLMYSLPAKGCKVVRLSNLKTIPRISVLWLLWTGLIITLQFPSVPFFPFADSQVRPMAVYPLLILLIIYLLPYAAQHGKVPKIALVLLLFIAITFTSSLFMSLVIPVHEFKGYVPVTRTLRGITPLVIGTAFYLLTISYLNTERKIINTLKILLCSYSLSLIWSALQIIYILLDVDMLFNSMNVIQGMFSTTQLMPGRVLGFSYEPSWMAHQLVVLIIPFLLPFLLYDISLFRFRLSSRITVERFLLFASVLILVFTFSRWGLFSLTCLVVLFIWHQRAQIRLRRIVSLLVVALLLVGFLYGFRSPVQKALHAVLGPSSEGIPLYVEIPSLGSRLSGWIVAWKTFLRYPIFGVGLGNTGFFYPEFVPSWGREFRLIRSYISPESPVFPSPKNLPLELLSETGLTGFAVYLLFVIGIAKMGFYLTKSLMVPYRIIGLGGLYSIIGFTINSFNTFSFAFPYTWISLGIVTAAFYRLKYRSSGGGQKCA